MTKKFKIVGINSEVETCECCGKTGLKRVVWLDQLDADGNLTGDVVAYGVNCAARVLGYNQKNTKAQNERKINDQMIEDKAEIRKTYFQTECMLVPSNNGNVFIEKKYRLGSIMQNMELSRQEAINYIKAQMINEHWFLS